MKKAPLYFAALGIFPTLVMASSLEIESVIEQVEIDQSGNKLTVFLSDNLPGECAPNNRIQWGLSDQNSKFLHSAIITSWATKSNVSIKYRANANCNQNSADGMSIRLLVR